MKGIKLVLLSFISAAMLTSCGMNNTNDQYCTVTGINGKYKS